MKNSNDIKALFEQMMRMDIAIVGIDGDPAHSTTVKKEDTLEKIYDELIADACVGNVCSHFYDAQGNLPKLSISGRMITVPVEALRKTPYVIGAAGGEFKAPSILGAARRSSSVIVTGNFKAPVEIELPVIQRQEINLIGHMMYVREDFADAIRFLSEGKARVDGLITKTFPAAQANEAFAYIDGHTAETMKVLLSF